MPPIVSFTCFCLFTFWKNNKVKVALNAKPVHWLMFPLLSATCWRMFWQRQTRLHLKSLNCCRKTIWPIISTCNEMKLSWCGFFAPPWLYWHYGLTPSHGIWLTQSNYWILLGMIGAKFIVLLFDCFEFQMAMKCL